MRNVHRWMPSKYVLTKSGLRASRDPRALAVSSRLAAQLVADELERLVRAHASGRIVDLGCGRVPLYELYAPLVGEAICADWPVSLHENEHVDVLCDVGAPLPFRGGIADSILSTDVLEHLPEPSTAFAEFSRVLAPGGTLILNTPFLYRVHEAPHDYLRHTRYSLERHARSAGLEIVEVVAVGGLPDVLIDLLCKGVHSVPGVGRWLADGLQWLGLRLGQTGLGRRARACTCSIFPLAHVLVARRPRDP